MTEEIRHTRVGRWSRAGRWRQLQFFIRWGVVLLLALPAQAADRYISNGGDDSWNGTSTTESAPDGPWLSFSKGATFLDTAVAGDRVLLKRDDTWNETDTVLDFSNDGPHGALGNPVILGAYGTGTNDPIIDVVCTDCVEVIKARGHTLDTNGVRHFQIENIKIMTSGTPAAGTRPDKAVFFLLEEARAYNASYVTFKDVVITGFRDGIVNHSDNLTLDGCTISNMYSIAPESLGGNESGLFNKGDNTTVTNSFFTDNGRLTDALDWDIYNSHRSNVTITNNVFTRGPTGIKLRAWDTALIKGNTFIDIEFGALTFGADDGAEPNNPTTTATDITVEGNLFYGARDVITIKSQSGSTQVGYHTATNVIVRNNIMYNNDTSAGVGGHIALQDETGDGFDDIQIYNNTIWNVDDAHNRAAIYITEPDITNLVIRNNVFHKTANASDRALLTAIPATFTESTNIIDNNLYWCEVSPCDIIENGTTDYTTLAAFRSAYPSPAHEVNGQEGDPLLENPTTDFHLTASSALALENAYSMGSGLEDYDEEIRPDTGWDIGADQYSVGAPAVGLECGGP